MNNKTFVLTILQMFAVKDLNWIGIDLENGFFYCIIAPTDLIHLDNIEIIGDVIEELLEEKDLAIAKKKYNFLKYGGSKVIKKTSSNKNIFGIIDFTHKIQYGKENNKFITIFRTLNGGTFLIKTKNRLANNVYATGEITGEILQELPVVNCTNILGVVCDQQLDVLSPFHGLDVVPKKWKKNLNLNMTSFEDIVDLTDKYVFSIDGDTTVDIDDALHYEFNEEKNLHVIGIHIADVANLFFGIDSRDSRDFLLLLLNNTSSIYPNGKIDMISKEVGEDICSLKEGAMRSVISLLLEFKQEKPFTLVSARLQLSKIINKSKLTYKNVDKLLNNEGFLKKDKILKDNIFLIRDIIDSQENFPVINEEVEDQYFDEKISRTIVCKLMTIYNSIVAKKLYDSHKKSIVRVHYGEQTQSFKIDRKIQDVIKRLETQKGFYRVAGECPIEELKHQGLGLTYYTHATSPIRRFVDFWNQLCLYETFYNRVSVTGLIDIKEKIGTINWKSFMIKKAYEQLSLVNIFHNKIQDKLEESYEGFIISIDEDNIGIYLTSNKKIFKFRLEVEGLLDVNSSEDEVSWTRKDNNSQFTLRKYMRIEVKIVIRKNKHIWNQKIGIELLSPSFSDFLLK